MAHVVILGAGMSGIPSCFEIRAKLGDNVDITVISDKSQFYFIPATPLIAVGLRKVEDISIEIEPVLKAKNAKLIISAVEKLYPEKNLVICKNGEKIKYDYLVIATGYKFDYESVEGLSNYSETIGTVAEVEKMRQKIPEFLENSNHIVIGATQGSACFGPAYEYAMLVDYDLRRKKVRENVSITFVTPEPYLGHFGIGGIGDINGMLEKYLLSRDVKWIANAKIDKFTEDKVYVTEYDADGVNKQQHILDSNFKMFMPPCRGIDVFKDIEDLVDSSGFIIVDDFQHNPKYKNIFAVGVCVSVLGTEKTPVSMEPPRTDYMIETMIKTAAENIRAMINGEELSRSEKLSTIWLADFGDDGMVFIALPQNPPRDVSWAAEGKWVHFAKIAFEKYFMRNLRRGTSEPIFEKYILKMASIDNIEDEKISRLEDCA